MTSKLSDWFRLHRDEMMKVDRSFGMELDQLSFRAEELEGIEARLDKLIEDYDEEQENWVEERGILLHDVECLQKELCDVADERDAALLRLHRVEQLLNLLESNAMDMRDLLELKDDGRHLQTKTERENDLDPNRSR